MKQSSGTKRQKLADRQTHSPHEHDEVPEALDCDDYSVTVRCSKCGMLGLAGIDRRDIGWGMVE